MGVSTALHSTIANFLLRKSTPDTPLIFSEAEGSAFITSERHHIQALSRAVLVLRMATGACAKLLRDTKISSSNLQFWWSYVGEQRGFWEPGYTPTELTDLWADIEAAMQEVQDWEDTNSGTQGSFADWLQKHPATTSALGGCERVALWGLGL